MTWKKNRKVLFISFFLFCFLLIFLSPLAPPLPQYRHLSFSLISCAIYLTLSLSASLLPVNCSPLCFSCQVSYLSSYPHLGPCSYSTSIRYCFELVFSFSVAFRAGLKRKDLGVRFPPTSQKPQCFGVHKRIHVCNTHVSNVTTC